ncbi:sirohydrochlorin chelatase [Marivibrio halodurans]|uniref:Sirohydrochlorin chelatase n=2 Tax=Marivibrio halodurans TaxID=2039722 RepID=A0A8J7SNR7_9PROT|nr:sirohydrochlorin chelatase [Marivibrio halodurans]MBP5858183.1 sirohydrochlorin chelatase [Marivibrio halodurans]
MVCGHGSRDEGAVREFEAIAATLKARWPHLPVDYGFLEFATPIIRTGLDNLRAAGATRILAVPGMLFAAGHAKNDIPSVLNTYAAQHGDVTITYGRELAVDLKMLKAASARVQEAVDAANESHGALANEEVCLVVIGRGASDPDANSNVAKMARMLWEGMGFGWCEVGYSGVTFPLVQPTLEHTARLGYKRVIVFPYFLFTGILVQRIYDHADAVAARHPDLQILKAGYLNDHPMVMETFAERVREILEGTNMMNCQMCKYRAQVLGFEDEVGLAQESHHHHVEGIGTGPGHDHDHGHEHEHDHHEHGHHHEHHHGHDHDGHGHDHHHHPYPRADHPHGPRSMTEGVRMPGDPSGAG